MEYRWLFVDEIAAYLGIKRDTVMGKGYITQHQKL